jgi:hypothetical protein
MNCQSPFCEGSAIPVVSDHHIIFRSHGGSDDDWNKIPLCAACHEYVHGRNNPKLHGKKVTGRQYMIAILHRLNSSQNMWRWDKVLAILIKKEGTG